LIRKRDKSIEVNITDLIISNSDMTGK